MIRRYAFATLVLLPTAALADQQQADQCAAGLGAEPRVIYDAAAPQVASSSDLRGLVTDTTKSLVMSGKISRGSAKNSAMAAGACLEKLKS